MTRTAEEIGFPQEVDNFPADGTYTCICNSAERWTSPNRNTPAVNLTFSCLVDNIPYQFTDKAFVTVGAIQRLNLIAQRLCGMQKETQLPDDDESCAATLARYILDNAAGKQVNLKIISEQETFVNRNGENQTVTRSRVAFDGYRRTEIDQPGQKDNIPF